MRLYEHLFERDPTRPKNTSSLALVLLAQVLLALVLLAQVSRHPRVVAAERPPDLLSILTLSKRLVDGATVQLREHDVGGEGARPLRPQVLIHPSPKFSESHERFFAREVPEKSSPSEVSPSKEGCSASGTLCERACH